jgi:hypothetical protein
MRRLRANVEQYKLPWSFYIGALKLAGSAPSKAEVVVKIGETRIWLQRPNYGNSFSKYLFLRLVAEGNQTRLHCRVGTHPVVIAFLIFWFGALLFMGFQAIPRGTSVFEGWWAAVSARSYSCASALRQ